MKRELLICLVVVAAIVQISQASTTITDTKITIDGRYVPTLIIGTSSDIKSTGVPSGTMFLETDTGMVYMFNGTTWKAVGAAKLSQLTVDSDLDMGGYKITNVGSPTDTNDTATKGYVDTGLATKLSKSGDTMSGDLDMGGNDILNTNDILPASDNVSSIGSPTARYNAIYVYGVYTGDLKFANGWILTEAEKLGLGHGIVLVSPDGSVYGVGNFKYLYNQYALVVAGVVIGVVMTAGAVVVDRKLRK